MYLKSSQKRIPNHPQIKINDQPLEIINTYKYLGILWDSNLTYKLHVEMVTKQIKPRLFVFSKNSILFDTVSCTYVLKCSNTSYDLVLPTDLVLDIQKHSGTFRPLRSMATHLIAHIAVRHLKRWCCPLNTTVNLI